MPPDTKYGRYGRRRILDATAGLGAVALAGCIGFGDSSGDDDTDEMADEIEGRGWDVAAESMKLTAEDHELTARIDPALQPAAGEDVSFTFDEPALYPFDSRTGEALKTKTETVAAGVDTEVSH